MSQNQSPTSGPAPTPITPPPSRRANRPPRINIHNLNSGSGMSQASMPPSAQPPYTSQTNYTGNGTQGPYWPPVANPFGYDNFMTKGYEGFLDLTKTGMSFGEKFTYGLYNKFSKLSRRWFTHMFLIIVLGLYNVAGALIFKAIEYRKEAAEIAQLHNDRIAFFNKILNLAKDPALNSTLFPGQMVDIMNDYSPVIDSVMRNGLVDKQNPWTFFNAMVYSSTIYTTIGHQERRLQFQSDIITQEYECLDGQLKIDDQNISASTKIDRESSTHARLDKEMEQPQRQRRRLGRSHREATPVQPPEPDPYPPDPSPQMVRMQIRPPGSMSAHESKILRRRDKTFASASARSQSQPREAEKLSSPDAHQLIKHRSLSSPRHKEESSESELTTGSSSQQRAVVGLGQKHDTLTRLEQNLQRFEDERRRFEADKRIFEREKREHKLRNRQQLDNEERKRLLQSYRKLSDRIQLPQDEEERRRLIHSLRLQRHEAPKGRVRNRSSGYEESSTQFSSSDAETAEEVHRRTRVQKTPQGYVAAPIRGAPPPPPSAVPKPPERRSVSRNNSLSPVRPQRRSKTPEQREEIIRKLEYVEVGESRDEVVKPRATEAEQQSDLMRKYMEAAERAEKAEAALAAQSLAAEGVRRSNSLRLAEKEEKPSKSEAKRSSSLERPLRANRSASLERNSPKEEVITTPEEHEDPEPELETEEKEDIPSAPKDYYPEAKPKPTFLERLKGLFRRKKKIPKEEVIVDVTAKPLPEKLVSRAFLYHLRLEARHEWRRLKLDYPQRVEEMSLIRNKCVSHCICLAMLLGFGGLMFRYTEGASEDIYKCQVRKVKRDFIDNLWDVSHNMREDDWKSLARQKLRKFEDELNTLAELGLRRFPGQRSWNFVNCFIFCWTVITTIGYGHITPKTPLGRSLTIIYAIIGIPVFLIVLADLGKLFTRSVKFLWAYVRRLYYTRSCRRIRKQQQIRDAMTGINTVYDFAIRRPSKYFGNSGEDNEENNAEADAEAGRSLATSHPETPTSPYPETFEVDDEFNLPISVATLLLVSYMLLGTFCYRILEDWPLLDSFYYMFISMSTIGFGDLVPTNPIYMMVSMIYLIFGLALTSMFINVVQIKLSDHFKHASAKVGATIGMNMASEFGDETGSQAKTPSELASVHGSRLDRIEEDGQEGNGGAASPPPPPPTSILRAPRPLSPVSNASADNVSPPPLLPRRQVSVEPQPQDAVENKKKKKHRFF